MKPFLKKLSSGIQIALIALAISVGVSYLFAQTPVDWSGPGYLTSGSPPPQDNVPAPINVGSIKQTKTGDVCTTVTGSEKCLSESGGLSGTAKKYSIWVDRNSSAPAYGPWSPTYARINYDSYTNVAGGVHVVDSNADGRLYVLTGASIPAGSDMSMTYTLNDITGIGLQSYWRDDATGGNVPIAVLSSGTRTITFNTGALNAWSGGIVVVYGPYAGGVEFVLTNVSIERTDGQPCVEGTSPNNVCKTTFPHTICAINQLGPDFGATDNDGSYCKAIQNGDDSWTLSGARNDDPGFICGMVCI